MNRSARDLVLWAEQRFIEADLCFGHGTDNARDEAVFLVFFAAGLGFDADDESLVSPLSAAVVTKAESLVRERIERRVPAAYLTGNMWFAGFNFSVDERVLVPRSPLAELINARFAPWLDATQLKRVLEIGTGSGCIAIATAMNLPHVRVDATDISEAALDIARSNLRCFIEASDRVTLHEADLFPVAAETYDLIITNPPYVPNTEVDALPPEYAHEPRLGLAAGDDGLDLVRQICRDAPKYLSEEGALIVDVGEMAEAVEREIDCVTFTWVELEHGGAGIGIARLEDFH